MVRACSGNGLNFVKVRLGRIQERAHIPVREGDGRPHRSSSPGLKLRWLNRLSPTGELQSKPSVKSNVLEIEKSQSLMACPLAVPGTFDWNTPRRCTGIGVSRQVGNDAPLLLLTQSHPSPSLHPAGLKIARSPALLHSIGSVATGPSSTAPSGRYNG